MLQLGDDIGNLVKLLNIQSFSNEESEVAETLLEYLPKLGFETWQDDIGNVYAKRGEAEHYPQFNAHMDSVKGYAKTSTTALKERVCNNCDNASSCIGTTYYNIYTQSKEFFNHPCHNLNNFKELSFYKYVPLNPITEEEEETNTKVARIDTKLNRIVGDGSRPIGGDDKCGIAMALSIAERNLEMPMKLFFPVSEEIGCVGSSYAINNHQDFFIDNLYSITIDRNGNDDICFTSAGGNNGRKKFMLQLFASWAINGIIPVKASGATADVVKIREVVYDCVNIACGYFNPHTNNEYVDIEGYVNILLALDHFVKTYTTTEKVFTREYVPKAIPKFNPPIMDTKVIGGTMTGTKNTEGKELCINNMRSLLLFKKLYNIDVELSEWEIKYLCKADKEKQRLGLLKFLKRFEKKSFKIPEYIGVNRYYSFIDAITLFMPDSYYNEICAFTEGKSRYFIGFDVVTNNFVKVYISTNDIDNGWVDKSGNLIMGDVAW